MWTRCISTHSLNTIRCSMGNQCRSLRVAVTWSCGPRRATSRAAAFWTHCSGAVVGSILRLDWVHVAKSVYARYVDGVCQLSSVLWPRGWVGNCRTSNWDISDSRQAVGSDVCFATASAECFTKPRVSVVLYTTGAFHLSMSHYIDLSVLGRAGFINYTIV